MCQSFTALFFSLVLSCTITINSSAQIIDFLHPINQQQATVFIFVQDSIHKKEVQNKLQDFTNFHFAFVNTDNLIPVMTEAMNHVLNDTTAQYINKLKCHLLIIGDATFNTTLDQISLDFFASSYYLYTDDYPFPTTSKTKVSPYTSTTMASIITYFSTQRKWVIEIEQLEEKYVELIFNKKRTNKGWGVSMHNSFPFTHKTEDYIPARIPSFALSRFHRMNNRWQLNGFLTVGWQQPDPQDILQKVLHKQDIDFRSIILSGEEEEIEIILDEVIGAYGYAAINIEGQYLFNTQGDFNPFIGFGGGYHGLVSTGIQLDTTIVIDPTNFSGGGFSPDSFRENNFNQSPTIHTLFDFIIPLSVGFQMALGKHIYIDLAARYQLSGRQIGGNDIFGSYLSFQTGLKFRFKKSKSIKHYNYIQHSSIHHP